MSGPLNFDNVLMTSTTTGTGAITLAGAVTGFQAVPAAADGLLARWTMYAVDGSGVRTGEWETWVGTYTHSGTSVARGVFKASSTGSAISWAAGTKRVGIALLASSVLSTLTGSDANTTMVPGGHYIVNATSWATVDRDYTLPITAAVGDRICITMLTGNATFELILKTGTGQTCALGGATIAAASEITRLFITGETMEFEYVAANKWVCVLDRRIAQKGLMRLSTSTTATESAGVYTFPTDVSGVWTIEANIGGVCTTSNGRITSRRAGFVAWAAGTYPVNNLADTNLWVMSIEKNGSGTVNYLFDQRHASTAQALSGGRSIGPVAMATDDYGRLRFQSNVGSKGLAAFAGLISFVAMTEVF